MALVLAMLLVKGKGAVTDYLDSPNFTEPMFVFAIMVIAGSRPIPRGRRARRAPARGRLCRPRGRWRSTSSCSRSFRCWLADHRAGGDDAGRADPARQILRLRTLQPPEVRDARRAVRQRVDRWNADPLRGAAGPDGCGKVAWDTPFMLATFGWKAALAVLANALLVTLV
jgi:hypothetical protein